MYGHYEYFSRQELYDLVWSTPASKLCERFGMSGRGLAKLCERHEIPVPERGWWAKKTAGQSVDQPRLRPISNSYLERISFYVKEDFRTYLSQDELDSFDKRLAAEATMPAPTMPAADESTNPLITRSRRKHRHPTGDEPLYIDIAVSDTLRDRALRLATALVEACELRGYSFKPRKGSTGGISTVDVLGNQIGVSIFEPPRRIPHVLTKSEAREKAVGRGWNIPEYDSEPSGEISISLDHNVSGERQSFSGGKDSSVESTLPALMKAFLRISMRMQAEKNYEAAERQRKYDEAERQRQAEERRRAEEARIAAEKRRRRELLADAVRYRRAKALHEMIEAVEQAVGARQVDDVAHGDWLAYARTVAESLDPIRRIVESLSVRTPTTG